MNIKKHQNNYSKTVYAAFKSYAPGVVNELQITAYPFHSGLRVLSTDGYKFFDDIHCQTVFQAKTEFKRLFNKYNGQ